LQRRLFFLAAEHLLDNDLFAVVESLEEFLHSQSNQLLFRELSRRRQRRETSVLLGSETDWNWFRCHGCTQTTALPAGKTKSLNGLEKNRRAAARKKLKKPLAF
jgi:hypothetical protein